MQLDLLETSRCWCELLFSNYHHKFIKRHSWIFFLSWPEPDKVENNKGDCTVRQATAKTDVQGSKKGEFSPLNTPLPRQSPNSSPLLPTPCICCSATGKNSFAEKDRRVVTMLVSHSSLWTQCTKHWAISKHAAETKYPNLTTRHVLSQHFWCRWTDQ